jgi:branched-chain amino acid transport system substrate-binding protein
MPRINGNRSGVSTAIAAVLLVVGLVVGAGIGYAVTAVSTTTTSSVSTLKGTVNIGVLDDLTDGLSGEGIKINFTVHQAITDINSWLSTTSYAGKVNFNVLVEDYALDNTKATTDMSTFKSSGISVVVGPLNSGTAQALLSTADSDQIVMISPSSTSAALAITPHTGVYLYRTAPTDDVQGKADASEMYGNGVKYLVQVYRQDTYGSGLANFTKADFTALGGTVVASIPYDISSTNFAPILSTLNTDWGTAVTDAGGNNNSVAIQIIAFDEGATLIQQASTQYPNLLKTPQPWYGSDGEEGEAAFTNSTIASSIQAVRLPSTVFGYTNSSKTGTLCAQLLTAIHQTCDSYPLGAYDDVWIAALTVLACGSNSGSCIQQTLPTVADNYYGVTGWTDLNPAGDRAVSDYLIYCITGTPSSLAWTVCGSWSYASNTVTWTNKPAT